MTLTMRELDEAAKREMTRRYKELGIDRPVPPAALAQGLSARSRANVLDWLDRKCQVQGKDGV